jgi:DNA-binding NtrC family response regulator
MTLAPRIIIASPEQWPRALLRAALREIGYDAIGTRTVTGAIRYLADEPGRGPVRAILVDVAAVAAAERNAVEELCERRGDVPVVLLASAVTATPSGCWARILRRPFSIDDAVSVVSGLIPLPAKHRVHVDSPEPDRTS